MLAHDESIEVAGPILSLSNRLSDEDLLAIASGKSQDRLLAISKRTSLSEKVSEVLVTHGNRDVVLSVTPKARVFRMPAIPNWSTGRSTMKCSRFAFPCARISRRSISMR